MRELPFDVGQFMGTTGASGGFTAYPAGSYVVELKEITTGQPYSSKPGTYTRYAGEFVLGPGASTEKTGNKFSDMIGDGKSGNAAYDEKDRQAHKALWEACLGGPVACNAYLAELAKAEQKIDADVLITRRYIILLSVGTKDASRNFVNDRLPYTDANWAYLTQNAQVQPPSGGNGQQQIAPPAPPAAVAAPPVPPPPSATAVGGPIPPPPPPPPRK